MRKPKSHTGLYYARTYRGLSQDKLSEETGVPKAQISKLETADTPHSRELTRTWAEKFAPALGIDAERILFWDKFGPPDDDLDSEGVAHGMEKPPRRTIKVKGYVGAGAEAHYYAVSQGDLGEIPASNQDPPNAVAVEVMGSSMGKLLEGWYVVYEDVRRPVTEDLNGELCVVGLPDDRILVKRIKAAGKGAYDLISETEEPIRNVKIEWAAKVTAFRPK